MSGDALLGAFDSISSRRVILFGGKGGVGKTTISTAAALHYSRSRETILFSTDPASNLVDLLGDTEESDALRIESLDADALYARFLEANLDSFLEIGDRGTYLDREELRRLFELAIPGIDELMAWMHIGELAEENPERIVVVDTAPTGHTMRMLASPEHFRRLALAFDAMQEKHRTIVRHLTRRETRDAIDAFIDDFDARAKRRHALLTDPAHAAFVPVMLAEPLVVEQTLHLVGELAGIDVPFLVLNRARGDERDAAARARVAPRRVVDAPRACAPLDSAERIREWSRASEPTIQPVAAPQGASASSATIRDLAPLVFFAGKGGVGKTTCSISVALQLAAAHPSRRYTILSVDPAHSLRDVFAGQTPPPNLAIETIDTREEWRRFREKLGDEIERAIASLTPRGLTLDQDLEAMQRLIEIAPPGADELFAITRLSDLIADESITGIVVDTAPTGHFLRLLDLPRTAGEWVRELMRIFLRYREVISSPSLGEELVRASRALKELDQTIRSKRTSVIVVTRPERIVLAETDRLLAELHRRNIPIGSVIANYLTPETDDPCDRAMRSHELTALATLDRPVIIGRRQRPPATLAELARLVPLSS